MSTKTMRPPPRRVPWPSPTGTGSNSNNSKDNHNTNTNTNTNKRKERDDGFERPKKPHTTGPTPSPRPRPNPMTRLPRVDELGAGSNPKRSHTQKGSKPMSNNDNKEEKKEEWGSKGNNQLLAGYLAHEYLTKGTVLGRRWDQLPSQRVEAHHEEKYDRYVEIASLLKTDGAHLPGVVNPTQLARYLRLLK